MFTRILKNTHLEEQDSTDKKHEQQVEGGKENELLYSILRDFVYTLQIDSVL